MKPLLIRSAIAVALWMACAATAAVSPVAANGKLHVQGSYLLNERGDTVQLRGVASHGLQWFSKFYAAGDAFGAAADQWGADVIRLTLYLSEDGYLTSKTITKAQFDRMIDDYVKVCVQKGIYVILDWHVHKPGYPAYYLPQAKDFFTRMSAKYAKLPNVMWEICNEPSSAPLTEIQSGQPGVTDPGHDVAWSEIVAYAKEVVPLIKANNPDAVILVGTPSWSSLGISSKGNDAWKEIAANKLSYSNVLYVIHYYAASHNFQAAYEAASQQLPLFSTEWAAAGFQETSSNDEGKGQAYADMLRRRKIGWCYWNYSDGTPGIFATFDSSTAATGPFAPGGSNITPTGRLVYKWLSQPEDSWSNYVPTALIAEGGRLRAHRQSSVFIRTPEGLRILVGGGSGGSMIHAVDGSGRAYSGSIRPVRR